MIKIFNLTLTPVSSTGQALSLSKGKDKYVAMVRQARLPKNLFGEQAHHERLLTDLNSRGNK